MSRGTTKLAFVRRLGSSWRDLADSLDIPSYERRRFATGDEPRAIWDWLEVRNRLGALRPSLLAIDRTDLADLFPLE
jgi:hypothetical protein